MGAPDSDRPAFEELGAFAIADGVHRFLDCSLHGEHVHAVHDVGRHALCAALLAMSVTAW